MRATPTKPRPTMSPVLLLFGSSSRLGAIGARTGAASGLASGLGPAPMARRSSTFALLEGLFAPIAEVALASARMSMRPEASPTAWPAGLLGAAAAGELDPPNDGLLLDDELP